MMFTELFDKVDGVIFEGLGLSEAYGKPVMLIKHNPTNLVTQISTECVHNMTWEQIEPILTGVREPVVLQHMSRICGYMSQFSNWNPSKIGELRDRHKGDYAFPAAALSS